MEEPFDKTASDTIDFLESRLRRLEFLLTGAADHQAQLHLQKVQGQGRDGEITSRLAMLDADLNKLKSKSKVVKDILDLCKIFKSP